MEDMVVIDYFFTVILSLVAIAIVLLALVSDFYGLIYNKFIKIWCSIILGIVLYFVVSSVCSSIYAHTYTDIYKNHQINKEDIITVTEVDFNELDKLADNGFKTVKIYKSFHVPSNYLYIYKEEDTAKYKAIKLPVKLLSVITENVTVSEKFFLSTTVLNIKLDGNKVIINNKLTFGDLEDSNKFNDVLRNLVNNYGDTSYKEVQANIDIKKELEEYEKYDYEEAKIKKIKENSKHITDYNIPPFN